MNKKLPPREVWKLFSPFWSIRNKQALVALVVLTIVVIGGSAFNAWITHFTRNFYNALEKRDFHAFTVAVFQSFLGSAATAAFFTLDTWVKQWLEFGWRKALTENVASRWLSGNTFYRLERQQIADNPDQRISEDVRLFAERSVGLGYSFLTNLGLLSSMGYLLWTIAGPMKVGGMTIPGYMFWMAITFGILNTLVSHWAGHTLAESKIAQQKVEADFRFALSQQRDAAEQIAFYAGGSVELQRLRSLFGNIADNWRVIMRRTFKLNFIHLNFNSYSGLVPVFAIAPKLFSGEISLGQMMQSNLAYGATVMAVSWFASSYSSLVDWSAVTRRVIGLNRCLDAQEDQGIEVKGDPGKDKLSTSGLELALPQGQPLIRVGEVKFRTGERWLVRGASGAGKSTLLRALAGIWPHGRGSVEIPRGAKVMFLPQKSYIPVGTLKEALCYPAPPSSYTDAECMDALAASRLEKLVNQLAVSERWAHRLSGGEQQRLAFARVFLTKPDFVFMDEATSALDNPTEARLYSLMAERLPATSIISVAHRTTLERYHRMALELSAGGVSKTHLESPDVGAASTVN